MKKPCPHCDGTVTAHKSRFDKVYEVHLRDCPARPTTKENP